MQHRLLGGFHLLRCTSPLMCISAGVLLLSNMPVFGEPAKDPDALKQRADQVLQMDPVLAHKNLWVVFDCAESLKENGRNEEALEYLLKGFKVWPWSMKHQFMVSDLMRQQGDEEGAKKRLEPLLPYMEKDEDYIKAKELLGQSVDASLPPIERLEGNGLVLVLLPLGEVDLALLHEVAASLSENLKIPVMLQGVQIPMPPPTQDGLQLKLAETRAMLTGKGLEFPPLVDALREFKLKAADLERDDVMLRVLKEWALRAGATEEAFEADVKACSEIKRWDTEALLPVIDEVTYPYHRPEVMYLGVTTADLYSEKYNFLFSMSPPAHAVFSYLRFTAAYTGGEPNRERLARRIRLVCMQSLVLMCDVKQCSDPSCPVSYQNNLDEHDAKKERYCPNCAKAFAKAVHEAKARFRGWQPAAPPPMPLRP